MKLLQSHDARQRRVDEINARDQGECNDTPGRSRGSSQAKTALQRWVRGGVSNEFPKQPTAEIEISDLCETYRPTFLNVIGPVTYQSPFLLTVEHLLRPLSHRVNFMQSTFPCSRQTPVSALPIFP